MTLTLSTTIQSSPETLQLIKMYHSIKFGRRRINSSVCTVETVIFDCITPHSDLDFEDSKLIFPHDTLAHDAASITVPSLVKTGSAVEKVHTIRTNTETLNLCWDLDLEHSNPNFSLHTPAYDGLPSKYVWLQKNQQFRRNTRKS